MNRILDQALSVISSVIIPNVGNEKENFFSKIWKYNQFTIEMMFYSEVRAGEGKVD